MKFNNVFTKTIQIVFAYLLILFIFQVFRVLPLFLFRGDNSIGATGHDLFLAFWTGFKFDTIIITYLFSILLIFLIPYIFIKGDRYNRLLNQIFKVFFISISFLILILVSIDYYYYKFFHTHLDVMAFGIVEDDTMAVLASVWTDYPIIRIFIGLVASFYAIRWFFRRIMLKDYRFFSNNHVVKTAYILVFISVFILGMRGSLDTFPIGKDDMVVCNNNVVNHITPNSVFYLKEAIVDKMRFQIDTSITPILSKYKYHNPKLAIEQYLKKTTSGELTEELEFKTDTNSFLEKHPPHVVFILMESLGNYYLDLHSKELNLLGELENQMEDCYLYRNFLSGCNGTISSLESLVVNTPSTPVSQSKFKNIPLNSSCALPFKNAGYNTIYITGGDLAWRNTGTYIKNQYFDEIEGRGEILKYIEGSSDGTWGSYDQYVFDRIFDKLEANERMGKSSFIFSLTTSNHTPFERPSGYQAFPVNLNQKIKDQIKTTEDIAIQNFTSYQYSNHYLGELIKRIRNSEFGKNTIIAVTGDHNNRQLFEFSDVQAFYQYSVPFILYVPEPYLKQKVVSVERFGSHKDIFPTLYNLSLSGQEYLKSGNDLLNSDTTTHFYGVNAYNLGMDEQGAYYYSSSLAYEWENNSHQLKPAGDKEQFEELKNDIRSYSFSMDYYVRSSIKKSFQSNSR